MKELAKELAVAGAKGFLEGLGVNLAVVVVLVAMGFVVKKHDERLSKKDEAE